jgi:uncharacterized RDD family membrane protein YckC
MPLIKISTVFNIDLEFETADIPRRILAYFVDFTLLVLYFMVAKYFLYGSTMPLGFQFQQIMGLDILVISTPMLLYSLVSEILLHGQSIGKKLTDIRVISLDGKEPYLSQYFIRWIFRVFEWPFFFGYVFFTGGNLLAYISITAFLGIGVVTAIAVTPMNQRLGDLAANTVVVKTRSYFSVEDTLFVDIADENYKAQFPEVLRLSDRDINTVNKILKNYSNKRNKDICIRLANKIQAVLNIKTEMEAVLFLKTLLRDYNYLSNK